MKIQSTSIADSFLITSDKFQDKRGSFIKTFHASTYTQKKIIINFKEEYYSISKKHVFRGLHLQLPPHESSKLIYPITGKILDTTIDLRKNSKTYLANFTYELNAEKGEILFIPPGVAHGFFSLEDNTIVVCKADKEYAPYHEKSIHYQSVGISLSSKPILSEKDENAQTLKEFIKIYGDQLI